MSSPNIQARRFVPRKAKTVVIGKTSVSLYPKVDPTMSDPEKALAYQQSRAVLAGADLDQRARILALAERLDLMLTAESSLVDWERKLSKNWFNFANLTIISWHNARGGIIINTTVADNPSILLPVQNGAAAMCPTENVKFSDLNTIVPAPSCVLRGEYYIELPQRTFQLLNGHNVAYNLTTFLGAADLRTLLPLEIQRDILDEMHQDGPFDLLQPAFNLTFCQPDSSVVYGDLKTLVVKLASGTVHEQLFSVLVLGYSMEPHSVLKHIWQSYIDDSGIPVRQSAQVYYTTFLNTMRPFYDLEEYPIDVAGVFMAHIELTLTKSFQAHYPDFGQARKRAVIIQHPILTDMLKALIRVEADVSNILEIVSADKRGGEQFHVKASAVPAYPSVAERTINSYTPGGGDALKSLEKDGEDMSCFGCGHPHPWSKKVNGKWVVICPNKDQPGVRDRAKLNVLQYQTRQRRKTRENRKRKNAHTLNLEDLPRSTQDRILLQHWAKASGATTNATSVSVSLSITGATSSVGTGVKCGSITLHQDMVVLASDSTKPPIPIAIHSPMAHLTLQTGTST
jgi:hypothetical protein